MSVRSTADEKISSAKDHIKQGIKDLSEIVIDEVYGTEDFSASYIQKVYECMQELISIKQKLE